MISITPLEMWIREKAQIAWGLTGKSFAKALEDYQIRRLNETIDNARRNSPFYARHLASLQEAPISTLSDITKIPFTLPSDIGKDPFHFLAVRQDDIARIVTLRTSGSTGEAKRIFFTKDDLELTIDFFHHGMSTLVRPGQKVAILLPGDTPDSVGDLLDRGLRKMDVHTLIYGPVTDPDRAAEVVASFGAHCLVGIPTQVLGVVCSRTGIEIGKNRIESVLLSTDYVPQAIIRTLERFWGCRVFNHYGMTEMGLGGGVDCQAHDGYHLREADLYFEVVNPETGEVCPDGVAGEVVFTTLTRRGMPLIRYRTGDISRIIPGHCPCGTVLRRMEYVKGRWNGAVYLGSNCTLTLSDIDEALFQLPHLLDYRATVSKEKNGKFRLHVDVHRTEGQGPTVQAILQMLSDVEAIRRSIANGYLYVPTVCFSQEGRWATNGVIKRKIIFLDSWRD